MHLTRSRETSFVGNFMEIIPCHIRCFLKMRYFPRKMQNTSFWKVQAVKRTTFRDGGRGGGSAVFG